MQGSKLIRQAESSYSKLFSGFTCLTGKLTKYNAWSKNIKQDYLDLQITVFVAIVKKPVACFILAQSSQFT